MSPREGTLTEVVREGLEKACREFTARIEALGFRRTKKSLWTRVHLLTADFIHFHRRGSAYERCADDLVRFVVEQGEPWFQRFGNAEDLLTLPDSVLQPATKELLKAALSGRPDANTRAASLKLLGVRKT